jgi:hypothetical protein
MTPTPPARVSRNLRALFVAASVLFVLTFLTGGVFLYLGNIQPRLQKPVGEFGQYLLIVSTLNGLIVAGVYSQIRSWRRSISEQ